jgi:hypothetical protein
MAAAFGSLGETVAGLAKTGFFKWFNLEPTGEGAGGEAVYRPSGEAFHDLVRLVVRPDGGLLQTLTLEVRRSFIADPQQGAFARDVVKSFLEALDCAGDPAIAPVIDEIFFRGPRGPMIMRGPAPSLPATESAAYLVFNGRQESWSGKSRGVTLTFANRAGPEGGWFTLQAERAKAPGRLAGLFARRGSKA